MTVRTTRQISSLTLAGAEQLADLAVAEASKQGATICVGVVDVAGHLLAFRRMDGAGLISIDVAIGKARTAALLGKPASVFEQMIDKGKPSLLAVPGAVSLGGGQPVNWEDAIVGAIGISGATGDGDETMAVAVIRAFGERKA